MSQSFHEQTLGHVWVLLKQILGRTTMEKLFVSHNKHVNHQHLSHDVHCSNVLAKTPQASKHASTRLKTLPWTRSRISLVGNWWGKWWDDGLGSSGSHGHSGKGWQLGLELEFIKCVTGNSFVYLLWLMVLWTNNTDYTNSWTWSTRITQSTAKNTTKTHRNNNYKRW